MTLALVFALAAMSISPQTLIHQDSEHRTVTVSDRAHNLELRLSYEDRCVIDRVSVNGKQVVNPETGAYSGIKVADTWFTTRTGIDSPKVTCTANSVTISGIRFGGGGVEVEETWVLAAHGDAIDWRIDRRYLSKGTLMDTASPRWDFADMSTWTGAILGTGGVAWGKLFDQPNATYGIHIGSATLWNRTDDSCLEIKSQISPGHQVALRFTREPTGDYSLAGEITPGELMTKHGQARFLRDRQDIWSPFEVSEGESASVSYSLRALSYEKAFDRGTFNGLDGKAAREIMNTIGRIGVIDSKIMGSNGWYSGYAVLHEPWIALMGLAVDDPNYTANMARTLDFQRDKAIASDGMVKSRWSYGPGDSTPGTYDSSGFYECQWGRLMDTQPSYVINVSEQFDLTGDLAWARGQKAACESALNYLIKRDSNGNGLVEMAEDSRSAHKSSDWLDVVWASFENAFVNAQMYRALVAWSDIEDLLGDHRLAAAYRANAFKLKTSFNKPIAEGGFWNPEKKWYAYWRDKDGSIHGDNLVLPVNFMAIAYGLCDDKQRSSAILSQVEEQMTKESLFCWPANIYPYAADETANSTFPTYENGDIFLAWAEPGIRAYAGYDPAIAVKYVKSVLERYEKDGLAFQRYLRGNQAGAGDDILANNCSAVVGLYRDIYGIQPKHNRLYLAPRLTKELNGTVVKYPLRGRLLNIELSVGLYAVASGGWRMECGEDFGVAFSGTGMEFFNRDQSNPTLSIASAIPVTIKVASDRQWLAMGTGSVIRYKLAGLKAKTTFRVLANGRLVTQGKASAAGVATFEVKSVRGQLQRLEVRGGL